MVSGHLRARRRVNSVFGEIFDLCIVWQHAGDNSLYSVGDLGHGEAEKDGKWGNSCSLGAYICAIWKSSHWAGRDVESDVFRSPSVVSSIVMVGSDIKSRRFFYLAQTTRTFGSGNFDCRLIITPTHRLAATTTGYKPLGGGQVP